MMKQKFLKKSLSAAIVLALAAQTVLPSGLCTRAETIQPTDFTFFDGQIVVSEGNYDGYEVEGTSLTIKKSGIYQVSGNCADGSVKIKKGTEDVTLLLDGLTLSSSDTAPICCGKSSSVTILANADTANFLTDASYNNDDTYPDNLNAENAVIKCKDGSNVTIGGSGTLHITANGKNGIKSGASTDTEGEASLTIEDVALQITANVNDAVNAESLLAVKSGRLDIHAADDALHSDYNLIIGEKDSALGPEITIASCYEGLEGADVRIYSGDIEIHATDDGINAANSDLTGYAFSLEIAGGEVYVDAASGDGIDSNGTLTISGGKTEVFSTDSGDNAPLDSDGDFRITGGTVFAVGNSGMAQTPASGSQNYVTFGASGSGGGPGGFGGGFGGPGQRPGGRGSQQTEAAGLSSDGNAAQSLSSSISIAAGDTLSVADSSAAELFASEAVRGANYVFYSDGALAADAQYTLNINGSPAAEAVVGSGASQTPGGPSGGGTGTPPEPPADQEPGVTPPQNPEVTPQEPSTEPGQKPETPPQEPSADPDPEPEVTPQEPSADPEQEPEVKLPVSDSGTGDDNAAADISKSARVTLSKVSYVYDGRKKKPAVTVWAGYKKLTKNTDYTVTYKNNTKVGTASVVIAGSGVYTGTLTKTFTIVPKGTSIVGKIHAKSGRFTVKWKKQAKSATGYEIQYSTARRFTSGKTVAKKIRKASVTKFTSGKSKAKKKLYIRIRTYKTVNGKQYVSAWSKAKTVTL